MLLRLCLARAVAAFAFLFVPLLALAQAALDALPEAAKPPASWREALWTFVLLPLVTVLWNELRLWLAARRKSAEATKDQSTQALVETMLFRLVDAVGGPIKADLEPIFAKATDPASPGGAAITSDEWRELFVATETELRKVLEPDKLDLVMKTLGLGAAARLVAGWVLKRTFAVRQTALDGNVPTDAGLAIYGYPAGVRGAPVLDEVPSGG